MPEPVRARGTWQVGAIGGVPLRLHYSVLLALPFFGWLAEARMQGPVTLATLSGAGGALASTWTWAVVLTVALVATVALHEAVHALAAWAVGGRVDGITLLLFGGCGQARGVRNRAARLLVDGAAPLVTILVAVACFVAATRLPLQHIDSRFALLLVAQVQGVFGVIALVPAPPLDGGRLMVDLLERRMGRARATGHVATAGKAIAAAAALAGTALPSLWLIALAAVLWAGAEQSVRGAARTEALAGVTVRQLVVPVPWIDANAPLSSLAQRMLDEGALRFVVSRDGRLLGVVAAADVARVPLEERAAAHVRDVCRAVSAVDLEDKADAAQALMRAQDIDMLPVVDSSGANPSDGAGARGAGARGAGTGARHAVAGTLAGMVTRRAIADAEEVCALAPRRAPAVAAARSAEVAPEPRRARPRDDEGEDEGSRSVDLPGFGGTPQPA